MRVRQYIQKTMDYKYTCHHLTGKDNKLADIFSQHPNRPQRERPGICSLCEPDPVDEDCTPNETDLSFRLQAVREAAAPDAQYQNFREWIVRAKPQHKQELTKHLPDSGILETPADSRRRIHTPWSATPYPQANPSENAKRTTHESPLYSSDQSKACHVRHKWTWRTHADPVDCASALFPPSRKNHALFVATHKPFRYVSADWYEVAGK